MQPLALGAEALASGCPKKMGQKKEKHLMYLNHVQLIGFLGKDPEKRQVRGNGTNFTVLSVATQQSWKDGNDEWQSRTEWHRVVAFNRLGESITDTLHKGDHVLVDGMLVSTKYERENGKSKKAKAATRRTEHLACHRIRQCRGSSGFLREISGIIWVLGCRSERGKDLRRVE
jgi:single-strand DNA-binding protein